MNLQLLPSPLPSEPRPNKPVLIVLHATAGATAASSISHLRGVGRSYHYIITRDARDSAKIETVQNTEPVIIQCVANNRRAFHTGSTILAPGNLSINRSSIGISLANIQRKNNHEPYPAKQIAALNELLAHLKSKIPSLKFLTTHAVVQPWNRADPLKLKGEDFAARHGFEFFRPTAAQIEAHTPR